MQRSLFENLRLRLKLILNSEIERKTQKQDSVTHHKRFQDFENRIPDPQFFPKGKQIKKVNNSSWDFRTTASVELMRRRSLEC